MRRRVELFEHETAVVGRKLRGDNATLTEKDFDALVRFNDATRQRYFRVGHRRITTTQYVGYLEVGDLTIEILPKADRNTPAKSAPWRRGLLEMLRAATNIELETPDVASQRTGRSTLLELIIRRLLIEVDRLWREGLARGYRAEEDNLPVFRGKLVVARHVVENSVRADRFYTRYTTYDRNILPNQILRAALDVATHAAIDPALRARCVATGVLLGDVMPGRVTRASFDRVPVGRAFARYHNALVLARMVLEQAAPELRAGAVPVFALLFDMNLLWERYIAHVFRRVADSRCEVRTQDGRAFWRPHGQAARRVRPDIVVADPMTKSVRFIADTKWKVLQPGAPSDDELKQMFVYNELFGAPEAFLIYPAASGAADISGTYEAAGHGCGVVQIGVLSGGNWSASAIESQVAGLLAISGADNTSASRST